MSRHSSHDRVVTIADTTEVLEVICDEDSITPSSININVSMPSVDLKTEENEKEKVIICPCKAAVDAEREQKNAEEIKKSLKEKEIEMEEKFQERIKNEMEHLKDRFEFILQNEQIRSSYMLREAHRERKEKISALQTQLECKNLAGLMYVMCSERRKSKLEIMRLTEEYTNYIQALQSILEESQSLILRLSRGYKTAARVDFEWREKMMKVMKHFQNFVHNFIGGTPGGNQYLFDVPVLLKTDAPLEDNPHEDPCEDEEVSVKEVTVNSPEIQPDKPWWETMEGDSRPFIMFGDMADFKPPQRRDVLKSVKAAKTAPKKWKEYVFNEMFLKSKCPHSDVIKHEYLKRMPVPGKWECTQTDHQTFSRGSDTSRRITTASVDIRGNMGSILKMITSNGTPHTPKTTLLGARDSMEIASTTKLRERQRQTVDHGKVVLNIGNKVDSIFNEMYSEVEAEREEIEEPEPGPRETTSKIEDEDVGDESMSALGSVHNDSLQIIPSHVPDRDHKINYEKICPMEKCQKLQVDSFIRTLPAYMRASPFMHFEQTYDEYEACSPEQLEILKRRIEEKKRKEKVDFDVPDENPLLSWTPSVDGIAVQTSDMSISLPPCTCRVPSPSPASSRQKVYTVADLIPVKQKLNQIDAECFFDDNIEFNSFKVIGQDESKDNLCEKIKDFTTSRLQDIKKTLQQHPSLRDIF